MSLNEPLDEQSAKRLIRDILQNGTVRWSRTPSTSGSIAFTLDGCAPLTLEHFELTLFKEMARDAPSILRARFVSDRSGWKEAA